jgi:hypothetical protein
LKHQKENFEIKVKELRKTDMRKDKERSDALSQDKHSAMLTQKEMNRIR